MWKAARERVLDYDLQSRAGRVATAARGIRRAAAGMVARSDDDLFPAPTTGVSRVEKFRREALPPLDVISDESTVAVT